MVFFPIIVFLFVCFLLKRKVRHKYTGILYVLYKVVLNTGVAVTLLILIKVFIGDIYIIPSESMERTLSVNDYILLDKFEYGPRVPANFWNLPLVSAMTESSKHKGDRRAYKFGMLKNIKHEDVVVFSGFKNELPYHLIKRVIAVPGDTMSLHSDKVIVNGTTIAERDYYCYDYTDSLPNGFRNVLTLSNAELKQPDVPKGLKKRHQRFKYDGMNDVVVPKKGEIIIIDTINYSYYDFILQRFEGIRLDYSSLSVSPVKVIFSDNYYYLMGDNRSHSLDSRSFGFVPESFIEGKVITKF